jgi:molecular chaperone GrpE
VANSKIALLKSQLARALADYDNLQKRTQAQSEQLFTLTSIRFFNQILPAYDMLEHAGAHSEDPGIHMVIAEFKNTFTEHGFEQIVPQKEEEFDPEYHEAIDVVEDESKDNLVAEVVLSGWKYKDGTVIRHAKVKVYKTVGKSEDSK